MKLAKQIFTVLLIMSNITYGQDIIINQDAINANYNHIDGSITIQPSQADITASGIFIFEKDVSNLRSIILKPQNGYSISIIPSTISLLEDGIILTRLAPCEKDPDDPEFPNNFKSYNEMESTIQSYVIYNLNGALIQENRENDMPYEQAVYELPKNQLYIIKIHHSNGSITAEKVIHR